jgi:hypothetical protein
MSSSSVCFQAHRFRALTGIHTKWSKRKLGPRFQTAFYQTRVYDSRWVFQNVGQKIRHLLRLCTMVKMNFYYVSE